MLVEDTRAKEKEHQKRTNLCSIISITVRPDQIQIVLELLLRLVLLLFHLPEHRLKVHRVGYN